MLKRAKNRGVHTGCGDTEGFAAWVRENAVFLSQDEDENLDKLACLDGLLKDKRIVFLGEEDHWVHEKYDYRKLMLRYLFSRGWRFVGEEIGWSDGIRIDRYLETGDQTYLERIATYGYRGDARQDRNDTPSGLLKSVAGNYPTDAFKAEQIRLAALMHSLSQKDASECGRMRYFGYDVNAVPGGGYEDIRELLDGEESAPELAGINRLAVPVPGETVIQEMRRLDRLSRMIRDGISELKARLGEGRARLLGQHAIAMRDSLEYQRLAGPATSYRALNKAMATREEAMLRRVEFVLAQLQPEDKLVLMGHNRHLSKDMGGLKSLGAMPGGNRVPTLGAALSRRFPGQVFSIWMLHERGRSSQPFDGMASEYQSRPGSLNALLSQAGSGFMLPTDAGADERAACLREEMEVVGLYNVPYRAVLARQADAAYFIREVSPLML